MAPICLSEHITKQFLSILATSVSVLVWLYGLHTSLLISS